MAKEGSVAPKERVNIVYRPETGDAKEEVELPLKLLIVGDFTLKTNQTALEDRKPVNIDKDNFNEVLKAQNITLEMSVPNLLDKKAEGQSMAVKLSFESIKDFEPDAIVDKVPELRKIVELREALKALKGPLSNIPEFRRKVQDLVKDEGVRQRLLAELGLENK